MWRISDMWQILDSLLYNNMHMVTQSPAVSAVLHVAGDPPLPTIHNYFLQKIV